MFSVSNWAELAARFTHHVSEYVTFLPLCFMLYVFSSFCSAFFLCSCCAELLLTCPAAASSVLFPLFCLLLLPCFPLHTWSVSTLLAGPVFLPRCVSIQGLHPFWRPITSQRQTKAAKVAKVLQIPSLVPESRWTHPVVSVADEIAQPELKLWIFPPSSCLSFRAVCCTSQRPLDLCRPVTFVLLHSCVG